MFSSLILNLPRIYRIGNRYSLTDPAGSPCSRARGRCQSCPSGICNRQNLGELALANGADGSDVVHAVFLHHLLQRQHARLRTLDA